ncbi:MAG TPA: tRNA-dihydrouridine synthase [Candidatus Saccharimonadales bacterium]|nr:tRNA-dihydrouridine synthase [Candidatus Saccharimonadales bacterium]
MDATLRNIPRPFFVLAPMDDVTDTVFRQVVAGCARPDLFFTEFVNVDGLQSEGRDRVIKKLQKTAEEQPLIAQVWGKDPENFRKTAAELVDMGFAGVDLNMGCPQKVITGNGCCSALINNRDLALEIIKAVQEGVAGRVPVSVKTRLGWSSIDYTWHELLLQQNLDMLTIHGRTRSEMSTVPVHWDAVNDIRKLRDKLAPNTLFVGNGDIMTRQEGLELAEKYQLDGVMIGRGVFQDPYVFAAESPWPTFTKEQKVALYQKHVELFAATWQHAERRVPMLNKFCKIYINGFDGAKELREQLMACESTEELLKILRNA